MDSDLPQLKEVNDKINIQPRLDMTSLDQFLKDMDGVQVCLENLEGNQYEQIPTSKGNTAMSQRQNTMPLP